MYVISVSHKNTPVAVREVFSFGGEEKEAFLSQLIQEENGITGCVVLSTCNRTEIYFTGNLSEPFSFMEDFLAGQKKIKKNLVKHYICRFQGEGAVRHLFKVTAGMDSMVLGEDEILRQVKEAYQFSLGQKAADCECNILFQAAMHCARKIKTDTRITRLPVSVGTLAANEVCSFAASRKQKTGKETTVLIVGISGKIGTITARNLKKAEGIQLIGTRRRHGALALWKPGDENSWDYEERYQLLDRADVIISATSGPHYTFEADLVQKQKRSEKELLFLDLAVPRDIDQEIASIEGCTVKDMDFFNGKASENQTLKEQELVVMQEIIEHGLDAALKDLLFHQSLCRKQELKVFLEDKKFGKLVFGCREELDRKGFAAFLQVLETL